MEPKTLSASSIEAFESCEARYKLEFIDKAPQPGSKPALLGSACHAALQFWIESGQYKQPWPTVGALESAMKVVWESVYYDFFSDRTHYQEGLDIVLAWVRRTKFTGKEVLSTEIKEHFDLPTSRGNIPITYIWDRCDKLPQSDGSFDIEVIDYKTLIRPVQPQDLKFLIQPRMYALAAAIKYKDAKDIWVTYDLLRYSTVSAKFTRDDNIITWNYLKAVAERIYKSDGTNETINSSCRFCIKKADCITLRDHVFAGGILKHGEDSLEGLVDQRAELKNAYDALNQALDEIDRIILDKAEEDQVLSIKTSKTQMNIGGSSRRSISDQAAIKDIIGSDLSAIYGKVTISDIDEMVASGRIDSIQYDQLKQYITKSISSVRITTKPIRKFVS